LSRKNQKNKSALSIPTYQSSKKVNDDRKIEEVAITG
jgi:hypothetical protein